MNRRAVGWLLLIGWPWLTVGLLIFAELASRAYGSDWSPEARLMSHFLFVGAIGSGIGGICLTGRMGTMRPIAVGLAFSVGAVLFGLAVFLTDIAFRWR